MRDHIDDDDIRRLKAGLRPRRCVKCGSKLLWAMKPSGSGPLETFGCPAGCRVLQGIDIFLEPA